MILFKNETLALNDDTTMLWEPCDGVKDDKFDRDLHRTFEELEGRICEQCHHPFYAENDDQMLCYKCLKDNNLL